MLYIVIANAVTYILTLFAGSAALSFLKFDLYHCLLYTSRCVEETGG